MVPYVGASVLPLLPSHVLSSRNHHPKIKSPEARNDTEAIIKRPLNIEAKKSPQETANRASRTLDTLSPLWTPSVMLPPRKATFKANFRWEIPSSLPTCCPRPFAYWPVLPMLAEPVRRHHLSPSPWSGLFLRLVYEHPRHNILTRIFFVDFSLTPGSEEHPGRTLPLWLRVVLAHYGPNLFLHLSPPG